MNKKYTYILLVCLTFVGYFVFKKAFFASIYRWIESFIDLYALSFFLAYSMVGIPVFILLYFSSKKGLIYELGLSGGFIKGIVVAFVFALPMFIAYGFLSSFQINITWRNFWFMCVFAAFFEELYYRGFFFGQLFKHTYLGFFPALILGAFLFASLHLYQSNDPTTLIGIFATTFLGAGLFAWLYAEWNYNLWVPIGLHFFMNLSWEMFSVSENAFGNWEANVVRGLTIFLSIIGTIYYKRRQKIPLSVTKEVLFRKNTK